MSGGSFGYLARAVKYGGEWKERGSTLDRMALELEELDRDAGEATRLVIEKLTEAQLMAERLAEVWEAVEWWRSSDIRKEDVLKAIAEWKAS